MPTSNICESCNSDIGAGEKHIPTTDPPTMEELEDWLFDIENPRATDGCEIEPDGTCYHGHRSWLLVMGLI